MSETAAARDILAPYCEGRGLDLGFGGSAIKPDDPLCLTMDMAVGYCPSLEGHQQVFKGDATKLDFLCDETMDYIYHSHLIEDFTWDEIPAIMNEWRRVLRFGGHMVINCPDEPIYRAHCEKTGQPYNEAHKNADFSLATFKERIVPQTGPWEVVYENPLHGAYCWLLCLKKI